MLELLKDKNVYLFCIVLYSHFSPSLSAEFRFWAFLALLFLFSHLLLKGSSVEIDEKMKKSVIALSFPFIFASLYSLMLIIIGDADYYFIQRGFSQTFRTLCFIYSGYAILVKYKEKAVIFLFLSMSISYFILTVEGFARYGFYNSIMMATDLSADRFAKSEEGHEFDALFEFHEYGLALPLLVLYFIWSKGNFIYKLVPITIGLLASLLCAKRIAIAAFFVTLCFYYFSKNNNVKNLLRKYSGPVFVIMAFLYIYVIYEGLIFDFMDNFEIDLRGRDFFWTYFTNGSSFSIDYLGHGLGYISRYLNVTGAFGLITSVHNDILRVYLELGMLGSFIFFILYYSYNINSHYVHSEESGLYFLYCLLFTFVIYLTDNAIYYGLVQMIIVVMPFSISYKKENLQYE